MAKKSKRQRGGGNRREQQQVRRVTVPVTYAPSRLSDEMRSVLTDELVETILSRGVPDYLDSPESLKAYLFKVFSVPPDLEQLFLSIARGLLDGSSINKRMPIAINPNQHQPLLMWLCQMKYLNRTFGSHVDDDLVEMVLKAGARPNDTLANKVNALFIAVKYGSPKTVKLLLDAGINVEQHDEFGRTCLYNALEYPHPETLRLLLERLPVSEMFTGYYHDRSTYQMSLPDRILGLFLSDHVPVSWGSLGPPTADDMVDAIMLVRQRGARFSAEGSSVPMAALGLAFQGVSDHPGIRNVELFKQLGMAVVGMNIPGAFKPKDEKQDDGVVEALGCLAVGEESDEGACSICFCTFKKKLTLYCGHSYCRQCIIEYGTHDDGGATAKACPICRSQLCPELCSDSAPRARLTFEQVMGLGQQASSRSGPQHFTDEQVAAEAKAQGIYSTHSSFNSLRAKLVAGEERGRAASREFRQMIITPNDGSGPRQVLAQTKLELSATVPLIQGNDPCISTMCPSKGPVYVEILIAGVPILARISNQSIYTVFSQEVVDQLGLKRIESLRSRKFVDTVQMKKLRNTTFTCLEPVKITVGVIDVTLHNTVELSLDRGSGFGVQLGQDFLYSGLWCVVDTENTESGVMFRTLGESSWVIGSTDGRKESLRFYSHGGKMAELPLLHLNPFGRGTCPAISLKDTVSFEQCFWCCRVFPKGMKCCSDCEKQDRICTYCDERCFRAAWKIHKATKEAHRSEQEVD